MASTMLRLCLAMALVCSCRSFVPAVSISQCPSKPFMSLRHASQSSPAGPRASGVVRMQAPAVPTVSAPPASFSILLNQCYQSIAASIEEGGLLMEVDFPPLPTSQLDSSETGSYQVSDANIGLAVELAKALSAGGKQVAITLPDIAEYDRAIELKGNKKPTAGVFFHALTDSKKGRSQIESFDGLLSGLFGGKASGSVEADPNADIYLVLQSSCQELPDLMKLNELEPEKPLVLFNLKLDTLRGDLGLPGFPSKDTHHSFLSQFKPVYLLRPRAYSLSVPRPPFLISYQGILFRKFPEVYQSLLDTGRGTYRTVSTNKVRPDLGSFKQQLIDNLQLKESDNKPEQSGAGSWIRAGYKTQTWWEEDKNNEAKSLNWRS